MDIVLLHLQVDRKLIELPKQAESKTDKCLPNSAKERVDSDDPRDTYPNAESALEMFAELKIESFEPILTKFLMLIELPTEVQSKTETALPNRLKLLTEKLDPSWT
jgi:hypothetical protein